MSVSYKESAKRHFDDATHLKSVRGTSLGNSSQLFGISAECSLKALLIGLGLAVDASGGVQERRQFGHLPFLWREFVAFAHGRGGSMYVWLLNSVNPTNPPNPFTGWSVDDRYRSNAWLGSHIRPTVVTQQRADSQRCLQALQQAILDGIVT